MISPDGLSTYQGLDPTARMSPHVPEFTADPEAARELHRERVMEPGTVCPRGPAREDWHHEGRDGVWGGEEFEGQGKVLQVST